VLRPKGDGALLARELLARKVANKRKRFAPLNVLWMGMRDKTENPGELLQGTLDLLILKALAKEAMHGYGVAEWIHESSQDVLRVEEGALYPALHRLELKGLLSSEWGTSDNNRRAKYYALTTAGRKRLVEETEYWRRMSGAVARVLQTA
jgi:PadR family transcriptional regulator PadR